ncbi:hypothetical protein B0I37DRAFT_415406 [Chaetomium sp. MPI-CAGE-AT-0009]|nr:hypothetical protein B0I37DRAFT_415406 [Chaetomium sp. MPI-CAGE-AT-0009]
MTDSPFTTPKRKRSEMLNDGTLNLNTTTQFTFEVTTAADDGNASPRTRVAHRFRGLVIGGGSGGIGPSVELNTINIDAEDASRKRIKLPDVEMRDADNLPATAPVHSGFSSPPRRSGSDKRGSPSGRQPSSKSVSIALDDAVVEQSETVANTSTDENNDSTTATTPSLTPPTPLPVASRPPPQPRRRGPKRAGTPPFQFSTTTTTTTTTTNKPPPRGTTVATITDPVRASLTWHDDEITIYDPDDSDDDGTGINGIGFKPTPAEAYARTVRRRQQLAEYRKREERDARAKRSLRRRGGGGGASSPAPPGGLLGEVMAGGKKGKGERRRVRFLESRVEGELIGV